MSNVPLTNIEAGLASRTQPSTTPPMRRNRNSLAMARNWILNFLTFRGTPSSVSNPHTPQEAVLQELIYRHEVDRYPRGWARIAAEQDNSVNIALHRKFGYLSQRCFLHVQHKLTNLERELLELDLRIANENQAQGQPVLDRPGDATASDIEERDRKLDEILSVLAPYRKSILDDRDIGSLYEVGDIEHRLRYGTVKNSREITRDEMAFLYYVNDFVSTRPDKLRLSFERLFYKFRRSPIMRLIEQRDGREEERGTALYEAAISTAFRVFIIWCCAVVLLLPVVLLGFLPNLSTQSAAGIVIAFSAIFTIVMVWLESAQTSTILLGICAYLAVLVAFLTSLLERTSDA